MRRALLFSALAGVLLSALAALAVSRRVAQPVRALTSVARRAADGEYDAERATRGATRGAPKSHDEIGALDDALRHLVTALRDQQALVTAVRESAPARARVVAPAIAVATTSLSMRRAQGGAARIGASGSRAPGLPESSRTSAELAPGDLVADRYRIDGVLGSGEMGVTYRARDRVAGEPVALKRLRVSRFGHDSARLIETLRAETRSVRRLTHRNIVRVRDVGDDDGNPFVTMDVVDGISLAELLEASGPLREDAVLSLAKQLCRALEAARAHGVVHGNLSPRQMLVGYDGVLKVGDFALARIERGLRGSDGGTAGASAIPQLAGATVGTPEYMSPEQMLGEEPSSRADVYAAGVVLYECVTGATPFRTDSPLAFLAQKLGGAETPADAEALRAARPSRSSIALVLSDVISRMIVADVARRPASAGELLTVLERAG